jgi:hypothetical protein
MQWQTASGENGGVSLGTGDKLSAMRGATGIGQDFTPPLGRWFWLEVHQKLGASAGGGTLSEVFLDGRLVSSTSAANRSGSDPILRVSYGLVKAMLPPGGHAYAFVDRASVTTGPMGPLIFAAGPGSAGLVGVPKAPTGMRFGTPSGGSAPLNWNAAAAGDPTVDGYRIYQRQGDGSWAPAPVATTTGTSAVEPCGATYRVAAYRNFGFNDNTGSPSGESLYSADVGC